MDTEKNLTVFDKPSDQRELAHSGMARKRGCEAINRLKVMLVEKERTSKWLAEQLGKDPATVSKWCTNASQPTLDILLRIADLLEVDYTELVRR